MVFFAFDRSYSFSPGFLITVLGGAPNCDFVVGVGFWCLYAFNEFFVGFKVQNIGFFLDQWHLHKSSGVDCLVDLKSVRFQTRSDCR